MKDLEVERNFKIDNLRRTNKGLLKRSIILLLFSLIGLTFYSIQLAEWNKRRDLMESGSIVDTLSNKKIDLSKVGPKEFWYFLDGIYFGTKRYSNLFDSVSEENFGHVYHLILDSLYKTPSISDSQLKDAFLMIDSSYESIFDTVSGAGKIKVYHDLVDSILITYESGELFSGPNDLEHESFDSRILSEPFSKVGLEHLLDSVDEQRYSELNDPIFDTVRSKITNRMNESIGREDAPRDINIIGVEINGFVWNSFASLIFTMIFLNFSRILRSRDRMWKKLRKLKVKKEDVGLEFYELYTPNNEFKKTRLPSLSSIIFSLFLGMIFFTVCILPIQPIGNQLMPQYTGVSWLNTACMVIVGIEVLRIGYRQNLLGLKTIVLHVLGKKYLDGDSRPSFWDFKNLYYILGYFLIMSGLMVYVFYPSESSSEGFHLVITTLDILVYVVTVLFMVISLPLSFFLFKKYQSRVFEALVFASVVQYFVWGYCVLSSIWFFVIWSYFKANFIAFLIAFVAYFIYLKARRKYKVKLFK